MQEWKPQRKAIEDHLHSFGRYLPDANVFYCNVLVGLPRYLRWVDFDGIILHNTLMDCDVRYPPWWPQLCHQLKPLKRMKGVKVGLPQDDWENTQVLWELFRETGVQMLFTGAAPEHYEVLYPARKTGVTDRHTTFTGFVDDQFAARAKALSHEIKERDIDLGYRARRMGYLCGRLGELKHLLAEHFQAYDGRNGLKMDISNRKQDVFYGDDWIRFLLRCRAVLGCPGGSSLLDVDGTIRRKVEQYLKENPAASFEEVEKSCFAGQDGTFCLSVITPRHFECALTYTCQVLVEGHYSWEGLLKPGVHYIPIKRDFSNIEAVLEQVKDRAHCAQIAQNAYRDLVQSDKYTYREFAHQIYTRIQQLRPSRAASQSLRGGAVKALLSARRSSKMWQKLRWKLEYFWRISLPKRLGLKTYE